MSKHCIQPRGGQNSRLSIRGIFLNLMLEHGPRLLHFFVLKLCTVIFPRHHIKL
jgi:hypothetical protein